MILFGIVVLNNHFKTVLHQYVYFNCNFVLFGFFLIFLPSILGICCFNVFDVKGEISRLKIFSLYVCLFSRIIMAR